MQGSRWTKKNRISANKRKKWKGLKNEGRKNDKKTEENINEWKQNRKIVKKEVVDIKQEQ